MNGRSTHALLFLLLLGHLFLLSTHDRAEGNALERWLLAALGPLARGTTGFADAVRDAGGSLRLAGSLRRENAELHQEVDALREELARLQGVEEKLERLSRTTGYTRPDSGEILVADVVHLDPTSWLRTLVIYTGTVEPRRNQPVFTERALVGRVVVPAGRYAKVLLITDRSSSVSAMIVRTRQRGIVHGADAGTLRLDNIPIQADVRLGDQVVSAGIDGVFPRGIPIGEVDAIEAGAGLFHRIVIRPAIDFEALDHVFVLTREAVPAEIRETPTSEELSRLLAEDHARP